MNAVFHAIKWSLKYDFINCVSSLEVLCQRAIKLLPAGMDTTLSLDLTSSNCSLAPPDARFNIAACYSRTVGCSFFPKLPIELCEKYCGSSFGHYNLLDVIGALTTWVIPLFGLMANMHFAQSTLHGLGTDWPWMSGILKNLSPKHFVFSVQLANPIGTIWSLADKLDLGQQLWNHCERIKNNDLDRIANARRDIANVCNCLDDFGYEKFEERVNRLIALVTTETIKLDGEQVSVALLVCNHVKVASRDLAFARIRDTLHATFAILVYVGNAVASLLTSIPSSGLESLDYALPHTIALRELCFFLLAQVILSSAAGRWAQQWRPQVIMSIFAKEILDIENAIAKSRGQDIRPDIRSLWKDLAKEEIALWDGGSYVFRPQKSPFRKVITHSEDEFSRRNGRRWFLLVMACLMVVVAFSVSFTISSLTPTKGIGGRSLAEILYITVWTVNFLAEELWMVRQIDRRERLFMLIWLKDGIISLLALLFFFLPFIGEPFPSTVIWSAAAPFTNPRSGWYNSCRSWSAWFSRGNNAYLDLNVATTESWLDLRLYFSGIVAGSLAQILLALVIVFMSRKVYALSHRSSEENESELCQKT